MEEKKVMRREKYIYGKREREKERDAEKEPLPVFVGTLFIHLLSIYGCFCVTMAELNSCGRDHMTCTVKNIYYLTLYKKRFADLE